MQMASSETNSCQNQIVTRNYQKGTLGVGGWFMSQFWLTERLTDHVVVSMFRPNVLCEM